MERSKILLLSILSLCFIQLVNAKTLPPIHFNADNVIASEGVTIISGHVKVFIKDYILTANKIFLFTNKKKNVFKIEARGDVKLVGKNRFAISKIAIFYRNTGKVVMRGDPKIWEGSDELKGKEITLFLNSKKIIVKGAYGKLSPATLKGIK